ncbi:MAG: aspartate carbamoyltransferase [Acidobacteriales bacterium]|nr:aspartate carbamoyltransferase [Terriglobales bacterium]
MPISSPKPAARKSNPSIGVPFGSLLDIEHLTAKEISVIFENASRFHSRLAKNSSRQQLTKVLAGRRVALLFYEASTRTRVSFEFAAKNLGAVTTVVTAAASSIEKGESLVDTGYTIQATGAEVVVMRHPSSGAAQLLAQHLHVPVINAGDGMHEHPTQALLDAYTMLRHKKSLRGLNVLIVGDIFHSRVARSNIQLLSKFGAHVTLCGPPELLPALASSLAPGIEIQRNLENALVTADVIMMLRVQKERLEGLNLNIADYVANYQLTPDRMRLAPRDAVIMHPGPMIRGMEITAEVADGPQSAIVEQVANGVPVRMAVLTRALGIKK